MWKYNSPIGPIFIKYLPDEDKYGMFYNGIYWESCETPEAEADNVYMHCTGCYDWDILDGKVFNVPNDLDKWEKL